MAPHSSTLAWKIPWMEKPGGLPSMGSRRVGHNWATSLSLFTFMHWRRKQQPTPVFLPGESQGQGAWWAAVHGVAQSWTRLKWLSSSSREEMHRKWSQNFQIFNIIYVCVCVCVCVCWPILCSREEILSQVYYLKYKIILTIITKQTKANYCWISS